MKRREKLQFAIVTLALMSLLGLIYFIPRMPDKVELRRTAPPVMSIPPSQCGYWVMRGWTGRLGNLMFQYASFYGISNTQSVLNRKYAFFSDMPEILSNAFPNLTLPRFTVEETDNLLRNTSVKSLIESGCCRFDPIDKAALSKCDNNSFEIQGLRQSYKYFENVREEIRREFLDFKQSTTESCNRRFKNISIDNPNCTIIGVHLRRGDFTEKDKLEFGHSPATERYFQEAVRYFEETHFSKLVRIGPNPKFKRLLFLIFGDDYEWNLRTSENITLSFPSWTRIKVMERFLPAVDLCLLTKCDHVAMSTGSFGWWGGYLGRGIVTYQKEYAHNHLRNQYVQSDYFLPDWIPL